jgi:hypothetical protein
MIAIVETGTPTSDLRPPTSEGTNKRRGSALLIVLGFLSFMLISAVSFAVYMRIERQASSNYRHAVTARHLLNAGLYRAIDEIDSELRVERLTQGANTQDRSLKFPDWPGRVKPSAVCNGMDNGQEARVLSLEALSFLPAILVNDVRRYAVTNKADTVSGASGANGKYSYLGTKWRPLSLPVSSIAGSENAYEEAVIGRYAYLCVNVSDMLNVNVCKAAVRDSGTNRVSIGHLFGANSDQARKDFDTALANTDFKYESLQDFYACMYARSDPTFGSPYHQYLKNRTDLIFNSAGKHILVTDGRAEAQPTRKTACNIVQQQPLAPDSLSAARADPVTLTLLDASVDGRDGFKTALAKALTGGRMAGGNLDAGPFATCLADYLDEDGVPEQLNMPSVELVPMISQIMVPNIFWAPIVVSSSVPVPGASPARDKQVYSLLLVNNPSVAQMELEVVWPFKNVDKRANKPVFTAEIKAYLQVVKQHEPRTTQGFNQAPNEFVLVTGTGDVPDFWARDTSDPAACFDKVTVKFQFTAADVTVPMLEVDQGVPTAMDGYAIGKPVSVALVVFAQIKQGATVVDSVPQVMPYPAFKGMDPVTEFMAQQQKLFFQTGPSAALASGMQTGPTTKFEYEWSSLEVPDARFNYKPSNWIKNPEQNAITPAINPSTLALLGKEGRDGDIYLSVSDVGRLQSPGELGFIVRPFSYDPLGTSVDYRNQTSAENSADKDAMFRTIRLYDHGDPGDKVKFAHDLIYENFTAHSPDGSVPGARVNPLSDIPQVLAAAVEGVPTDYWVAARKAADQQIMIDNSFNKRLSQGDWRKFTNGWTQCLLNAKKPAVSDINTSWKTGLPDVYGDLNKFGWYSSASDGPEQIFNTQGGFTAPGVPETLSKPLHEIDRKMLFSYTLESFSDRQQLFLYFLRAEATVPSFGGSQEGGMRSLAGGRAVALVWRDPYPEGYGYDKANNTEIWLKKGQNAWYRQSPDTAMRMSPWYQVNIDAFNAKFESYQRDDSITKRFDGFHRSRILYFKQLE